MARLVLAVALLLGLAAARPARYDYGKYAGPFFAYLIRALPCEGTAANVGKFHAEFSPFNRSNPWVGQTYSGNLTLLEDLDDSCWVNRTQYAKHRGALVKIVSTFNARGHPAGHPGACSRLRKKREQWRAMFHSDPDAPGPCLVKAGTYTFRDWPTPGNLVNDSRQQPYGDYLLSETYGKAGRVLYCSCYDLRIIPRQ